MSRLEDTIRAALEADATLTGQLTGGIFDASEMDRQGWTLSNVERTASGRLKPFAVLRWGGSVPGGGLLSSGRQTLDVWVYEDTGYSAIRSVLDRLIVLLHQQYFTTDEKSAVRGTWLGNLAEGVADELGRASQAGGRYQFTYARR